MHGTWDRGQSLGMQCPCHSLYQDSHITALVVRHKEDLKTTLGAIPLQLLESRQISQSTRCAYKSSTNLRYTVSQNWLKEIIWVNTITFTLVQNVWLPSTV